MLEIKNFQENVSNNSPSLIAREFFNLILIFISVLVWYFLSQVSAQVLKVRIKSLFRRLEEQYPFLQKYPEIAINNQVHDPDSEGEGDSPGHCTCTCTCGAHPQSPSQARPKPSKNFIVGEESDGCGSEISLQLEDQKESTFPTQNSISDRVPTKNLIADRANTQNCIADHISTCSSSSISTASLESHCSSVVSIPTELLSTHPLHIPSIVITQAVDPLKHIVTSASATSAQLTSQKTPVNHCDSGKGSSELANHTANHTAPPCNTSGSSGSLSSASSGIFSNHSKGYVNGGFDPFPPNGNDNRRIRRSKSEEVTSRSFVSLSLDSDHRRLRGSRSLWDLGLRRDSEKLQRDSLCRSSTSLQDKFSIHTQLFEDMMKS